MTPAEIRATRERLGLTQGAAARLCGVDGRTWRRYEAGGHGMHEPVARLLRLLEAVPAVREALARHSPQERARGR